MCVREYDMPKTVGMCIGHKDRPRENQKMTIEYYTVIRSDTAKREGEDTWLTVIYLFCYLKKLEYRRSNISIYDIYIYIRIMHRRFRCRNKSTPRIRPPCRDVNTR